ncbi:esterase-5B-like [Episyrphus balteatus]|uniref:esterase-5B-like n=1 Tax=Episyrphus balteatus TaxID=286459 RepID=UPI00248612E3|nr:esterase-5B-like [Episyrphus balteatus]
MYTLISSLIIGILCATTMWRKESNEQDPIVQLPNGKIRGLNHGNYLSFESIPYAEPPIGENRFEAPKAYSVKWSDIRDATKPPVICMQWYQFLFKEDLLTGVEDCLTINVYTPSLSSENPYPVLVNIHGGSFMFGNAAEDKVDLLMKNGKLVIVKMNYRLGVLGFLSTGDDEITGNFGLKDQLLALEWIKANIATFNGNPDKITVMGESAGAASVHLHMMNKRFEKLATSAMSISGTVFSPWAIETHPAKKAFAVAKYLNCPTESSSSIKKCLKNKDAADIVRTTKEFQKNNIGFNPAVVFAPVIESKTAENTFLTEKPEIIIKNGKSAQIPWLASFAKNDGGYPCAEYMRKDSNGVEFIEVLNERWNELAPINIFLPSLVEEKELTAFSNKLRLKYMGNARFTAKNYFLLQKLCTDLIFADGVKKSWALHKEYTKSPVYGYMYDNPPPSGLGNVLSNRTDINFGTVHDDDCSLIFNSESVRASLPQNQRTMSSHFVKMIEDFCVTRSLQFGTCKFKENSSKTKGFLAMHITKDSCHSVSVDKL